MKSIKYIAMAYLLAGAVNVNAMDLNKIQVGYGKPDKDGLSSLEVKVNHLDNRVDSLESRVDKLEQNQTTTAVLARAAMAFAGDGRPAGTYPVSSGSYTVGSHTVTFDPYTVTLTK